MPCEYQLCHRDIGTHLPGSRWVCWWCRCLTRTWLFSAVPASVPHRSHLVPTRGARHRFRCCRSSGGPGRTWWGSTCRSDRSSRCRILRGLCWRTLRSAGDSGRLLEQNSIICWHFPNFILSNNNFTLLFIKRGYLNNFLTVDPRYPRLQCSNLISEEHKCHTTLFWAAVCCLFDPKLQPDFIYLGLGVRKKCYFCPVV